MNSGAGRDRAISPVVGIAVLLGMVAVGGVVVAVAGTGVLGSVQDEATTEQATASMDQLAGELQGSGDTVAQFPEDGSTHLDADAGSMTVRVGNDTLIDEPMGAVYYQQGDRRVAFQGGGVWRIDANGYSRMERSPPIRHVGHGSPTLVLPVTTVAGESGPVDGERLKRVGDARVFPSEDLDNPVTNETLVLEIESEFYRAWGEYLGDELGVNVTYDHTAQAVSADLESAEYNHTALPDSENGMTAFTFNEGTQLDIRNNVSIDSYDSTYGPYSDAAARHAGHVKSRADTYNMAGGDGGVVVKGNVDLTGTVDVTSGSAPTEVYGDLVTNATGNTSKVQGSNTLLHGTVSVAETFELHKGATIREDLIVGGDLPYFEGTVHGDVYVHGDADTTIDDAYDGEIHGDLVVAGNQSMSGTPGMTVHGNVTEHADPDALRDPLTPDLETREPDVDVAATIQEIANDNDNAGASDVDGGSNKLKNCPTTCELTAGDYYFDEFEVNGWAGDELRINTTNGPVRIAVDGETHIGNADVEVVYDSENPQPVQFYANDLYEFYQGAELHVPGDRTPVVEVFMHPSARWVIEGGSKWRGVVHGMSDGTTRTTIDLKGNEDSVFYGAVSGDIDTFDKDQTFHRDEALSYGRITEYDPSVLRESSQPALVVEDADVAYLHVEHERIEVG